MLLELGAGAVELPVSMGMSSKLAVHTGPEKRRLNSWNRYTQTTKYIYKIAMPVQCHILNWSESGRQCQFHSIIQTYNMKQC